MNPQSATEKRGAKQRKEISKFQHILNDAVDGGAISSWAQGNKIKRDASGNVISFVVSDGAPDGEGHRLSSATKTINARSLMAARNKLMNEYCDVHRDIAAQFVGPEKYWDFDFDGVDALVQIALFGKKVYG